MLFHIKPTSKAAHHVTATSQPFHENHDNDVEHFYDDENHEDDDVMIMMMHTMFVHSLTMKVPRKARPLW